MYPILNLARGIEGPNRQ